MDNKEEAKVTLVGKELLNDCIRKMFENAFGRIVPDEEIINTPLREEILDHLGDI